MYTAIAHSVVPTCSHLIGLLNLPAPRASDASAVIHCILGCVGFCGAASGAHRSDHIVGGGNTAVEEALYLANIASKVTLVHRRDSLRAEKVMQDRLLKNPKVEVIWDSVVEEITGETDPFPAVTGVRLKNIKTGEVSEHSTHGVFIAIGHAPATELFVGQLETKDGGYLVTEPGTPKTSIPGVYAAGDVTDDTYRQAVTAAGMGCQAALDAERYLASLED